MSRATVRKPLSLALLAALTACSAGAGPPIAGLPGGETQRGVAARRPHVITIGGVIKTNTYTIPATEIAAVQARGLTVFAKTKIVIAGELVYDPGTRLAFYSKSFVLSGSLHPTTGTGFRTLVKPVTDVISACSIVNGAFGNSPGYIQLDIPAGDGLSITANAQKNCTVQNYNGIGMTPGRTGTFVSSKLHDGETGGNIDIGTPKAIAAAVAAAKLAKVTVKAYAPAYVGIGYQMLGATGGNGASDPGEFDMPTNTWTLDSGNGGKGSDITIVAAAVGTPGTGALVAGNGGNGGDAVAPLTLDGTYTAPNAANLVSVQGSGGAGGASSIKASFVSSSIGINGGNGGNPGMVSAIAGNGYTGHAGTGGSVNLTLGKPGKGGAGTIAGITGAYPSMIFSGGGGSSPACCSAGGLGGSFTLARGKGVPALPNGVKVVLDGFGIGGAGGFNCGMPAGAGASGGNLFNEQNTAITFLDGAFDGGTGGGGTPGGAGGPGGKNMPAGTAVGSAGSGGVTC